MKVKNYKSLSYTISDYVLTFYNQNNSVYETKVLDQCHSSVRSTSYSKIKVDFRIECEQDELERIESYIQYINDLGFPISYKIINHDEETHGIEITMEYKDYTSSKSLYFAYVLIRNIAKLNVFVEVLVNILENYNKFRFKSLPLFATINYLIYFNNLQYKNNFGGNSIASSGYMNPSVVRPTTSYLSDKNTEIINKISNYSSRGRLLCIVLPIKLEDLVKLYNADTKVLDALFIREGEIVGYENSMNSNTFSSVDESKHKVVLQAIKSTKLSDIFNYIKEYNKVY
jgi:hypothetical protein